MAPNDWIELELRGLVLDAEANAPVVILQDVAETFYLPIWIGPFEALAISRALEGVAPPRPQTHDLLLKLVENLEATVAAVVIRAIVDSTFLGAIHLKVGEKLVEVDARPSDALAVAVRCGCKILASPDVAARGRAIDQETEQTEEERIRELLESLSPEDLGRYTM